jgi:hypothetical protein
LQNFIRDLLDTFGDGPAVLRLERDRLEYEQVEGALYQIAWFSHTLTIYTSGL